MAHTVTANPVIQAEGNRFARALDRAGIGRRDPIAALLPNVAEFLWSYRGCAWSGRRYTAMSWRWSADDAAYVFGNCEASLLIAHERFSALALAAVADRPHVQKVSVGGEIPGFTPYREFVAGCSDAPLADPVAGDTMLYTSGTTGRPKGVLRPLPLDSPPPSRVGRGGMMMLKTYLGGERDRVHLVSSPLYHSGPVSYCEGAALLGADIVLMDRWDAEEFLRLVERHRVSSTFLVPIHFVRLLKLPADVRARYDLSSLELVIHGAAPTSVDVKRQMIEWLGPILYEFYGGTEGGGISISSHEWLRKPGSVGRPYNPAVSVHILDDDGLPCAPGAEGSVYFDQPDRVEYKGDSEKTAEAHRGKLLTLGDIGYVDEEGYLFLCDRRADVIVTGGVNVYPAQIESVLLAHPAVGDCCVVGVPDDEWGEVVCAVVQPLGEPVEVAELLAWCRDRLAASQLPRQVEFSASLPRTETGKLARRTVRSGYWVGRERRI